MKKLLTYIFVLFGILFVIEVGILAYLWHFDPFGMRPFIVSFTEVVPDAQYQAQTSTLAIPDKNPKLSPSQEAALEKIGVDPAKLPTTMSPAMKACFIGKLGEARVTEILNGSAPTVTEVVGTRACYTTGT